MNQWISFVTAKSILVFFPLIFAISCTHSTSTLPSSSGKTGQMLIVIENQWWKSGIGDSLRSVFAEEILGLPQSEPVFSINQVFPSHFNNMFNIQRNIVIAEIKNGPPKVEIKKNVWASPQIVTWITAPDEKTWHELFAFNKLKLVNLYIQADRDRLMEAYASSKVMEITKEITDKFGIYMAFPGGYRIIKNANDFLWVRYENEDVNQSVLIYSIDYKDTAQFSTNQLVFVRDSLSKLYVPGPLPNSYMVTEKELTPFRKELNFRQDYTVELRGLWRVQNDFMGGPFVSISLVNKKTNKLITVDGFVYAPKLEKRLYLRQIEAIIFSLKLNEQL